MFKSYVNLTESSSLSYGCAQQKVFEVCKVNDMRTSHTSTSMRTRIDKYTLLHYFLQSSEIRALLDRAAIDRMQISEPDSRSR